MIKLKNILLEATRDELVLDVSRQIIFAFKRGDAQYTQDFDLSGPKVGDEDDANVELVCDFVKQSPLDYAYSIDGGAKGEDIDMKIIYDPKQFPEAYNNFIAEVKETLEKILEQDGLELGGGPPDMGAPMGAAPAGDTAEDVPLGAAEGEELCPCDEEDEESQIKINFDELDGSIQVELPNGNILELEKKYIKYYLIPSRPKPAFSAITSIAQFLFCIY